MLTFTQRGTNERAWKNLLQNWSRTVWMISLSTRLYFIQWDTTSWYAILGHAITVFTRFITLSSAQTHQSRGYMMSSSSFRLQLVQMYQNCTKFVQQFCCQILKSTLRNTVRTLGIYSQKFWFFHHQSMTLFRVTNNKWC